MILAAAVMWWLAAPVYGTVVQFFDASQSYAVVESGATWDTIRTEDYLFTLTRDKLFTGGTGGPPIGRNTRVNWPDGLEAQAVTAGPAPSNARITISRVDAGLFDMPAFTAKLLANTAGAGAHIEIMPQINGEDMFSEGFMFSASGFYGSTFSFDTTTPAYLGNTTPLHDYQSYKLTLYVDFAITDLTVNAEVIPEPSPSALFGVPAALLLQFRLRRRGRP